ncbi:MAG: lipid A deacylase LpxR family protein [Planctomycetota bacterium]|nr:MAG: lipid A deacylase LpxR family protein [Planctomycetota bacterium]
MPARTLLLCLVCLPAAGRQLELLDEPNAAMPPPEVVSLDERVGLMEAFADRERYEAQSVTIYWDNDGTYPNLFSNTDRYYTSGQGIEVGFAFDGAGIADRLAPGWEEPRFGVGLSLEQHIYTSEYITQVNPPLNDHPYGGWLSLNLAFQRADATRHDHFELGLGLTGQWSGAEAVQKFIHSVVPDQEDPEGWGTQQASELAVNFTYRRTWRTEKGRVFGAEFDMLPTVGFDLGNVFIRARGGAMVRVGMVLPDDFGPASLLGFKDHTAGAFADPCRDWSLYGYLSVNADAVARNMFLDGNTFADSRSTDREDLVGRLTVGVVARWKSAYLGWAQTWETKTFEAQPNGQTYGSVVLGCQWRF